MPIEVQTPKPWLRLADAFRLTGRHPILLDEILVPVVVVEDLSEDEVLLDVRNAQGGRELAAAVGFVGQLEVFNPAGSGVIADVQQVTFAGATTGDVFMGPSAVGLGSNIAGTWRDRRLLGTPLCRVRFQASAAAPTLVSPWSTRILADTPFTIQDVGVTLIPGSGWRLEWETQDSAAYAGFFWSERAE